jgi:hypothetical protein
MTYVSQTSKHKEAAANCMAQRERKNDVDYARSGGGTIGRAAMPCGASEIAGPSQATKTVWSEMVGRGAISVGVAASQFIDCPRQPNARHATM